MATYSELTTVTDVRSTYAGIIGTSDDALILQFVRAVSSEIVKAAGRQFVPRIETRYFDPVRDARNGVLTLDADLLSVTTLTNGDTTTIASSAYVKNPRNGTCFYSLELLPSSGLAWQYTTDPQNAISLAGVWGFDCSWIPGALSEWINTDTLGAAISTTTATTCTLATGGSVKGGQLVKIDSEYIYVSSVAGVTATLIRGVNGSTAATHSNGATISAWTLDASLEQLTKEASVALYRLRGNPLAETYVMDDGTQVVTPKDVFAYVRKRVVAMGLVRN